MTTRYVSNSATNGYGAGVASGSGLTKATAWTLAYALANMVAGDDVIINDGTYKSGTNWSWITAGILRAENTGAVRLQGTATTPVLYVNTGAVVGATHDLQGVIVDGEGAVTYAARCGTPAGNWIFKTTDCQFIGATSLAVYNPSTNCTANHTRITLGGACANGGYQSAAMGAGSSATFDGVNFAITAMVGGSGGVYLQASTTGVTARVNNVGGSIVMSSGTGSAGVYARSVLLTMDNPANKYLTVSGAGTVNHLVYVRPISSIAAAAPAIRGFKGANLTLNGYLITVGNDSIDATIDGFANSPVIMGCDVIGDAASTLKHGIIVVGQVGGAIVRNRVRNAAISVMFKRCTGNCFQLDNDISEPLDNSGGGVLRSKGSTGVVAAFNKVKMRAGRFTEAFVLDQNPEGANPVSTGYVIGNSIYSPDAASRLAAVPNDGSSAVFRDNNYSLPAGVSGTPFTYGASTYASVALWTAANELTSRSVTPVTSVDRSFWRSTYAPVAGLLPSPLAAQVVD